MSEHWKPSKTFTSMAQQQEGLKEVKMQKQLAKTESEQAKERLEIIEGLMDQCEELAQQPLSWYEMSQLGLAHDHLFKVAKKLTFDYNLESAKVPQGETE